MASETVDILPLLFRSGFTMDEGMRNFSPTFFVVTMAILFTVVRAIVQNYIQSFLVKFSSMDPSKHHKFSESAWKFLVYLPLWSWCFKEIAMSNWYPHISLWWENYPSTDFPVSFQYLYLTQLAYYTHGFFTHSFMEIKRADFWPMFIHHIAAIVLILGSWTCGYHRTGGALFLLHDLLDIILESGKMSVYLGYQFLANIEFIILIVVWAYCRIYLFGTKLIAGSLAGLESVGDTRPVWNCLFVFLNILWLLNCYWWYLMLKIAWRTIINKKELQDCREDKE